MSEIFPDGLMDFHVKERLVKGVHFLLDHFQHETPSEHFTKPPVLVGQNKPVMRFPYDSEGTAVEL